MWWPKNWGVGDDFARLAAQNNAWLGQQERVESRQHLGYFAALAAAADRWPDKCAGRN